MPADGRYPTDLTAEFQTLASREITSRDTLRRRLLLLLLALGTNMGIRAIVDSATGERGEPVETEAALRRMRRLYVNRENLRSAITKLVNATLAVRDSDGGARGPRARRTPSSSRRSSPEEHAGAGLLRACRRARPRDQHGGD